MSFSNGYLSIKLHEVKFNEELSEDLSIECIMIVGSQTFTMDASLIKKNSASWNIKPVHINMSAASNIRITIQTKSENKRILGATKIPLDSITKGFTVSSFELQNQNGAECGKIYLELEYISGIPMGGMEGYLSAVNKKAEDEYEILDKMAEDEEEPVTHKHQKQLHGMKSDSVRGMVTPLSKSD